MDEREELGCEGRLQAGWMQIEEYSGARFVFVAGTGSAVSEVQQRDRTSTKSNYWQNRWRKNKELSAADLTGG